jgi:TetR/AcrR family transcriptional regulator, regulator of cefoperazone and chloramphenicol sensitivity
MTALPDPVSTRQRLLMTAAQIFADHGYAGTSVRDICARAEANVAAINYHFGGKDELYAEILRLPIRHVEASIPVFSNPALPLSEALRHMYLGMLAPLRSGSAEAAALRVVARCMAAGGGDGPRPDPAVVLQHHAALAELVGRHLPPATDPQVIHTLCGALVGMAMHAVMGQVHEGPAPRMWSGGGEEEVAALADRLARYGAAIVAAEGRS